MAALNELHHVAVIFLLLLFMMSSSYARLLNGFHGSHLHDLALHGESINELMKNQPTYDSPHDPSFNMKVTENSVTKFQKLGQQYTSLWLNLLPRGVVPPSGPSRRTNDING